MDMLLNLKKFQDPIFRWRLYYSQTRHLSHNVADPFWGEIPYLGGNNRFGWLLISVRSTLP